MTKSDITVGLMIKTGNRKRRGAATKPAGWPATLLKFQISGIPT